MSVTTNQIQQLKALDHTITVDIALSTATGTDFAIFGHVRDLRRRKGWVDALQNRYRSLGNSAGVVIEQPTAWTWVYFHPQSTFTVVPGRTTLAIFDPRDVALTQVCPPDRGVSAEFVDADGPLSDGMYRGGY
jgi:hypothetical protein